MTKVCTKCKQEKDISAFSPYKQWTRNRCKQCQKEYFNAWLKKNPKKAKVYSQRHSKYATQWHARRRKEDPIFYLRVLMGNRIYAALKKCKTTSATQLLGCTLDELKIHLETQFSPGMTWENYGEWHLDHIKPCASFDLTKESEQKACFHYSNLQPLWAYDNLSKGKKYYGKFNK